MIWKLYLLESFESIENSTSTCVFYFQPDIEKNVIKRIKTKFEFNPVIDFSFISFFNKRKHTLLKIIQNIPILVNIEK